MDIFYTPDTTATPTDWKNVDHNGILRPARIGRDGHILYTRSQKTFILPTAQTSRVKETQKNGGTQPITGYDQSENK